MTEYLIAGLGNPGTEHAGQRHNAGAWCVERLSARHAIGLKRARRASAGRGEIEGRSVLLVRPKTYMNQSGEAIGPLLRSERLPVDRLIVVYDELDLEEGRIRLRARGSAAGHNGLKSIIAASGSSDFGRIRIGIGRPRDGGVPSWDPDVVMGHVLSDPPPEARQALAESVEKACDAIAAILRVGWERAMDVYNQAGQTTRPPEVEPSEDVSESEGGPIRTR